MVLSRYGRSPVLPHLGWKAAPGRKDRQREEEELCADSVYSLKPPTTYSTILSKATEWSVVWARLFLCNAHTLHWAPW